MVSNLDYLKGGVWSDAPEGGLSHTFEDNKHAHRKAQVEGSVHRRWTPDRRNSHHVGTADMALDDAFDCHLYGSGYVP